APLARRGVTACPKIAAKTTAKPSRTRPTSIDLNFKKTRILRAFCSFLTDADPAKRESLLQAPLPPAFAWSANERASYPPNSLEYSRCVHRADVQPARAADRRVHLRRRQVVPAGESRRVRRSPRSSNRAPAARAARFVRPGQRDSRDVGMDALRVLRRIRRTVHRYDDRGDQQRRARSIRFVRPRFLLFQRRF